MESNAQYSENEKSEYQKVLNIALDKVSEPKKSFMVLGWCLNKIKDNKWYQLGGFRSLSQFARQILHLSSSRASSLKNLWIKFSNGDGTPTLNKRYEGYSISKLEELIPVKTEDLAFFNEQMTVSEIRKIKKEKKKCRQMDLDKAAGTNTEADLDVSAIHPDKYPNHDVIKINNVKSSMNRIQKDSIEYAACQASITPIIIDCIKKHPKTPKTEYVPNKYGTYISNEYVIIEFDPDTPDKAESFISRKYAQFFQKYGYIPKYFNAKNCVEITSCARTLATSCGTGTGIGSIFL